MTQKFTLTSLRKRVKQKCCVSECNIKCTVGNQRMLKKKRYDSLKGMIGNDDAFGFIELHTV